MLLRPLSCLSCCLFASEESILEHECSRLALCSKMCLKIGIGDILQCLGRYALNMVSGLLVPCFHHLLFHCILRYYSDLLRHFHHSNSDEENIIWNFRLISVLGPRTVPSRPKNAINLGGPRISNCHRIADSHLDTVLSSYSRP